VDAVFNLELPSNAAHYAHRAGRTGRMGATGVVVSVAAPTERFVIERLAARLGVPIEVRGCFGPSAERGIEGCREFGGDCM